MDLGSLLGGLDDPQGKDGASDDPLSDMLGALLGGAQGDQPAQNLPRNDGDEVLGSLSGSMGNAPGAGQGGDMGDLLGSLMGGAGGQGGAGGDMGDLLGSLLGGAGAQGAGGDPMAGMMGGLLGGLLGGGMGGASASAGAAGNMGGLNSALAPLANSLADKLGIPREMAMAALAIIVPMIMSKLMNSGQGGDPLGGTGSMQRQGLTFTPDEQQEMVNQLTAQTGMDEKSAAYTLNQAVQVLGGQ